MARTVRVNDFVRWAIAGRPYESCHGYVRAEVNAETFFTIEVRMLDGSLQILRPKSVVVTMRPPAMSDLAKVEEWLRG